MGKTTEFALLRRKRRRVRTFRRIVLVGVALVVMAIAIIAVDRVYRWDISCRFGNLISTLRPGRGFPVSVDGLDILQLLPMGRDVAVVSSSGIYIYNSQGVHLALWMNNYNNPLCKSGGGKLLTYDLGGTHFRIDNKTRQLFNADTSGKILAADMSQNGSFAIVTEVRGHLAKVTAYDPRYAEMYSWYTNACYVYGIALSGNGDKFAAAGLSVTEGKLTAHLRIHHMALDESEAEMAVIKLPEEMILSLCWNDRGELQVITDHGIYLFDDYGRQQAQIPLPGKLIAYENRTQGGVVLACGEYREAQGVQVLVYDAQLEQMGSTVMDKKVFSIQSIKGGRILLLTDGRLYLADGHLGQVRARRADNLYMMCGVDNHIYGITPSGLIRTGL